jgi:transcriptional regulator with XRE-family HTH domain
VAEDLKRLGERITELRGDNLPAAALARRAGISAAYLHQIEKAAINKKTGRPSRPAVTVLRCIAWAIPGALASELLELAGWSDDAVYDRVDEARKDRAERAGSISEETLASYQDALRKAAEQLQGLVEGGPLHPPEAGTEAR